VRKLLPSGFNYLRKRSADASRRQDATSANQTPRVELTLRRGVYDAIISRPVFEYLQLRHRPGVGRTYAGGGLTEIAGLDNDGRTWALDCNQLKITIERFYQLTSTYNSFESVLCHMKFTLISKNYEHAVIITWRVVF